ncbi:MAG: VOC family protein [Ilumatobacteraceae bacterium]|jgi:PhnB protein
MARVSTYLNFAGNTEEAFRFYREVFGTEFIGEIARMGDVPSNPEAPQLTEDEQQLVMHVELPILGGHVLMGTDVVTSLGHRLDVGNNTSIMLEPDTRDEADRLYAGLAEGSPGGTGMVEMFWGAYWGAFEDRFGIRWMINVNAA